MVVEAVHDLSDDTRALLDGAQQQRTAVGRDVTAIEVRPDFASTWTLENQRPSLTICSHLTVGSPC